MSGRFPALLTGPLWFIAAACAPLVGLDEDYYVRDSAGGESPIAGSGGSAGGGSSMAGSGGSVGGESPMAGSGGVPVGGAPSAGLPDTLPEGRLAYHRYDKYEDGDSEAFVVDLPSGQRSPELGQLFGLCGVLSPSFSPDGNKLAVAARPSDGPCPVGDAKRNELEIYVLDLTNLDSPSKVKVTENTVPDEDPSFGPSGDFLLVKRDDDIAKLMLESAVLPHTTCEAIIPGSGSYCFDREGEQIKPVMSSSGLVFYQEDTNESADVYYFDLALFEADPTRQPGTVAARENVYEARPSIFGEWLYFARWANFGNPADRVVRKSLESLESLGELEAIAAIDYDDISDYTDPCGISDDLVLFATDQGGGLHDLFVANFADGTTRNLDDWFSEPINSVEDELSPTFWVAPAK